MDKFNQLIAKAISTTSDDEAIACLRMAKKIGGEIQSSSGNYKSAEYEKVVKAAYRLSSERDILRNERDVLKKQVKAQASTINNQRTKIITLSLICMTAIMLSSILSHIIA